MSAHNFFEGFFALPEAQLKEQYDRYRDIFMKLELRDKYNDEGVLKRVKTKRSVHTRAKLSQRHIDYLQREIFGE